MLPVEEMSTIGSEIRRIRQAMGLTLMEFGAHVGLPWQTVHGYESGRLMPPADRLLVIAHKSRGVAEPFQFERVARAVSRAAA